jgi:hypothetical protein
MPHFNGFVFDNGKTKTTEYGDSKDAKEGYVLDALNARATGSVVASVIDFEGSEKEAKAELVDKRTKRK